MLLIESALKVVREHESEVGGMRIEGHLAGIPR
jgi:hypothetical protein